MKRPCETFDMHTRAHCAADGLCWRTNKTATTMMCMIIWISYNYDIMSEKKKYIVNAKHNFIIGKTVMRCQCSVQHEFKHLTKSILFVIWFYIVLVLQKFVVFFSQNTENIVRWSMLTFICCSKTRILVKHFLHGIIENLLINTLDTSC